MDSDSNPIVSETSSFIILTIKNIEKGIAIYIDPRPLVKSAYQKNIFSYFSTKTYVVGTQNNRLNEMVLLST